MFSDDVIFRAAHCVYASQFADEFERAGHNFPAGSDLYNVVPVLTADEHRPIIGPVLQNIDKALGVPLATVFEAGGITDEEEQADALGDLLMGVLGHGVSIDDNYSAEWDEGCRKCGTSGRLPYDDMTAYGELAYQKILDSGYSADDEGEPIIETAYSWHGGQGSALYAFASTANVQSEDHRAEVLAEIDECLGRAKHDDDQEGVVGLERLRGAVEKAKIGQLFFYV